MNRGEDAARGDGAASSGGLTQPPSILMARAVVRALVDAGVRRVVLAPGSRSAPVVPALAAAEADGLLTVRVVVDERSAGFIALGASRAALAGEPAADGPGEEPRAEGPAAVVTTSGTAVANLHPAVLEADAAGVPLLIISADRPHEMVGTGANQTTEQTGIFGRAVRAVVDLPADLPLDLGAGPALLAVSGGVRRACSAALGSADDDPGPAQVNIRFRPPLAPVAGPDGAVPSAGPAPGARGGRSDAPTVPVRPARPGAAGARSGDEVRVIAGASAPAVPGEERRGEAQRGIVVAGDLTDPAIGARARSLAEALDWPLLAEPSSGARGGPQALTRYAELLRTDAGRVLVDRAERVVVFGHPTLSRSISALLARTDPAVDVVTGTARWTDVAGGARAIARIRCGSGPLDVECRALREALALAPAPAGWTDHWRGAVAALPPLPDESGALTARSVALAVHDSCAPRGGARAPWLVIGSSMAIRHLDRLAPPTVGPAARVIANRGLAGIDGTLATALGVCDWRRGSERRRAEGGEAVPGAPVRVLLGDLAFLHDAMSLSRGRCESEPDLQVIVLDDAGGSIFSTLEYPAVTAPQILERYFTAPQAADVAVLARALGARVHVPSTMSEMRHVLAEPVRGLSVVHVRLGSPG